MGYFLLFSSPVQDRGRTWARDSKCRANGLCSIIFSPGPKLVQDRVPKSRCRTNVSAIHTQEETFSCSANGSNSATAVWAVLTNHQTKINNSQNDLSSMPKMT